MSKYSNEFKIKVVNAYLLGEGGAGTIANKYKVARTCVQQWVAQYKLGGKFTERTRHFSGEFKLKVLNYQQYITGGTEALFQKQGRRSKMPKKSLIPNKPREEWTKDEELAYLRMENDFLKKYMALVQEDDRKKQQQKKDREQSMLSEN